MRTQTMIAVWLLLLAGCAALTPGADPVVVRSEQAADASKKTIEAFLAFERNNRDALWKADHGIKRAADTLRVKAPPAIKALRSATKTYKLVKSQEHADSVDLWLAEVAALVNQAQAALTRATKLKEAP